MDARTLLTRPAKLAFSLLVALALGACGEDIVYVDREPFNPPPDASFGFLGYFDAAIKQTTCGNCHESYQAAWVQTAHANTWSVVEASADQQASCNGCHTVSEMGNAVSDPAGYNKVTHPAYQDVQCESCHGPGLEHVTNIGQGVVIRPLAKISMQGTGTCGECHTGNQHPYAEEWAASPHAQVVSSATSSSCKDCHDARGTLLKWGVDHNYVERAGTDQLPVSCAVCHNPHGSSNPNQLRFSITSTDPANNLCMKCHNRRIEPAGGSSHGASPHAPQGATLLGFAGYRPAGFQYGTDRIFGTHATTERNPRLCAGCHVSPFTVTDPADGSFVYQSTGHLFNAIPCVDAQGKPTGDNSCEYTATARSWKVCTSSGCHGSAASAANIYNAVRDRLEDLASVIWIDVDHDHAIEATDQGYLALVAAAQPGAFTVDATISPAEGAGFNAKLCGPELYENGDRSKGVHNVFLCEALLRASIEELQTTYGLPAPSAAVQRILDQPLGGANAGAVQFSRSSTGR